MIPCGSGVCGSVGLAHKPVVGPLIYLVIGHQTVQYVGQTYRTLQERIREHLCEEPQSAGLVARRLLRPSSRATSAETVDLLEHAARKAMRPQMGGGGRALGAIVPGATIRAPLIRDGRGRRR